MYTTANTSSLAPILGKKYTAIEVYQGAKERNKFYDFHDEAEMTRRAFEDEELVDYTFTRDTKWRAYLGEAQTTAEGIEYYTVKNQYAVVVGVSSETTIEELKIPSRLGGRTVREISIYSENETFPVKNLTIPSTVDNAMIYLLPHSSEQTLSKITFEEGVNSIQVCSMQTEELVIPSTAYYVDLRRPSYGANAYTEALMVGDQKITVNGGEHYYTEDGLLYSKEGDLVHQFGGRENLILHLNDKVKRVLRRSINGLAKTVYIPENVEYFDLGFNEWSLRYNTLWRDTIMTSINASPVFFVKSEKVLGQWLKDYLKEDVFGFYPFMKAGFRYVLPDASIDVAAVLNKYAGDTLTAAEKTELVAYCTPTETTIESYEVVYYEAMELAIINDHMIGAATKYDIDQNTWVWPAGAHSFLSEDFEKEELNDRVYRDYYHYHNSTTEE